MGDRPAAAARMDFSRFPRRRVATGDVLFFEDEESRELYVLLLGTLGVFRDEVQVATIDEPLSLVGEMSALTGAPRVATVRALRAATLVQVDDPARLFDEYPQLGARLARQLAARLGEMNRRFVDVKARLARHAAGRLPDAGPAPGGAPAPARAPAPFLAAPAPLPLPAGADDGSAAMLESLTAILDWDPSLGHPT